MKISHDTLRLLTELGDVDAEAFFLYSTGPYFWRKNNFWDWV